MMNENRGTGPEGENDFVSSGDLMENEALISSIRSEVDSTTEGLSVEELSTLATTAEEEAKAAQENSLTDTSTEAAEKAYTLTWRANLIKSKLEKAR